MPQDLIYNHLAKWRDEFMEVIPYYCQAMSLGLSDTNKNLAYFKKEHLLFSFCMFMLCFYIEESSFYRNMAPFC